MPAADDTRDLQQLVDRLAGARPEDIEAVLDGLIPAKRAKVETLLDEFEETSRLRPAGIAMAPTDGPGKAYSPWLAQRMVPVEATAGVAMTAFARQALREAATDLAELDTPEEAPRRSLFGSIGEWFRGVGGAV